MELKIGTYNICHCRNFENWLNGDKDLPEKVDLNKTAEAIKNLELDVIGLNEVYDEGNKKEYVKQTERLAKLAGYKYHAFALGERFSWTTIGNAVLSRYPILEVKSIIVEKPSEEVRALENGSGWEDRVILIADVDVCGKVIRVIESHFGLNLIEQENIVKEVCRVIDNSNYPVVLMGDFNVTPNSDVLKDLFDRLISVAKETSNEDFTFATYNPKEQIDYIFVPRTTKIKSCVAHNVFTSDHRPLTAEIIIE